MRIPRLSVLGPISATIDGQDIELGGRRQRAVLAALVLSSPRVVDADDLLTRAWPADSPPNKATLHFYISKLRAALEPDRPRTAAAQVLIRRGPGYALILPPDAIDAVEFDRLLASGAAASAAGRWVEAVTMFTAAQALWRGRPYAEVADLPWIQPEIARLDELRLAAGEDLLDALLHAGRAAEVVGPAQQATARHPLRERGWELLATALYRTGRQAEALAALRTVRGVLADELGIDPGPGLVAVEQAVLAQAPIPPATPAVLNSVPAATLPSSAVPPLPLTGLVGRVNDVAGVEALLASGRLVTLTGPGGVGKTRLAMEVVRRQSSQPAGPGSETVHWVELAGLVDQTLLAVTVAASLGIPGVRDAQGLAAVLSGQRLLLVLDNAEQLIDAVAELVPLLLSRSPGLRILLTSRETVDVPGELIWEVQPLDPPTDAVRLFVARATAAMPNWVPDAAES
ncbi:MAG: BTAD domain-containing putative transcriptional regulator, partial [Nakamurella sp.]